MIQAGPPEICKEEEVCPQGICTSQDGAREQSSCFWRGLMVHCEFYGQINAVQFYDDWMEDLKPFSPGFQSKPKEVLLISPCIRVHCIRSHLT